MIEKYTTHDLIEFIIKNYQKSERKEDIDRSLSILKDRLSPKVYYVPEIDKDIDFISIQRSSIDRVEKYITHIKAFEEIIKDFGKQNIKRYEILDEKDKVFLSSYLFFKVIDKYSKYSDPKYEMVYDLEESSPVIRYLRLPDQDSSLYIKHAYWNLYTFYNDYYKFSCDAKWEDHKAQLKKEAEKKIELLNKVDHAALAVDYILVDRSHKIYAPEYFSNLKSFLTSIIKYCDE